MPRSPARVAPGSAEDIAAIVQGLRRVVKALAVYSQEVHRNFGLTGPQLWAIKTLQRLGPLSAGELAGELVVHQSSVSVLVDRLEERNLVRRARGKPDRRFVRIELTGRGRELAANAPEPAQGRLLYALKAMTAPEVRNIRRSVDRLVDAMEATDIKAPFFFSDA